ncbi:signal recognition particle-docking protein FtsY [Thermoanaerobacter sp. X514]|uniref:signal recognition particle-docking protein FtsY n=1 Tax=Thermoanaerobacter sp. (strain X514) TaxID=399726 RepID=UPI0000E1DECC|nr:signal recognition particle-docking protein FtsY [Thermoanaerobacter sp. X514]ABY93001.1 signal recognition particle-docking protein FtsY [Thermoanaerobacter sp. X514]KUJ91442.1 MAG: signal recognition particle-docking protein FtsY [Thermoanaerobacter thermocopriae]HAA65079.1 signal recognition particle-docking protein FtsY [Thermoanaerobacter sp.]HCD09837.1 signal recognition particle-docking protein FtsY [Thermoanaerobacter sp.]
MLNFFDKSKKESETAEEKKGFFQKIKEGLLKTRENLTSKIDSIVTIGRKIDEELLEELEEILILADIGISTTSKIIEGIRQKAKERKIYDASQIKELLAEEVYEILQKDVEPFTLTSPMVILNVGVNGVGKTTTIGKLAYLYKKEGKKVMLAAGDTFRAAAIDQLEIWAERVNCPIIKHQEGSDPASVIFDGIQASKARGIDILICDTAGRLHNKKNLMEELRKIRKVIDREYPEARVETFLVLDATTGQNALQQAKIFKEVSDITGIVLTKLDGTAKGGIVVAIKSELNVPIRYIGIGEGIEDLQAFDAKSFVSAIFQ